MISNQYDQQNHFIMYEQELYTDILYIAAQQKIYARTSDQVTIYSTQSIPYPQQGDIIITDHGASGKDIEIRLKVMCSVSEATKTEELVIPVEILQTSRELDDRLFDRRLRLQRLDLFREKVTTVNRCLVHHRTPFFRSTTAFSISSHVTDFGRSSSSAIARTSVRRASFCSTSYWFTSPRACSKSRCFSS